MTSTIIPVPQFPNVPQEPGVPALIRQVGAVSTIASTFYAVSQYTNITPFGNWGIYKSDGKTKALEPDSFIGVQFKKDRRISDYPQEQGAFASYNKVTMPFDAIVRVTCGGTLEKRSQFISTLDTLSASLELLTLITPEVTYLSANIERYDYHRQLGNGAGYIIADVYFREIRVTAATNYTVSNSKANPTQVQDPSAQASQNQGAVQPSPVTSTLSPYIARPK